MPETQNNSTQTRPKVPTSSLHPQTSPFPPTTQKLVMQNSSSVPSTIPEKMDTKTPVEIGTRGTVGFLIMREIEYFTHLESDKPQHLCTEMASTSTQPNPKFGSFATTPRKKKKGGRRKLVPNMCSMVEVVKCNRPNVNSGLGYRNLRADDVKKLQA
ncbi:hypothetical protein RHGRI_018579 [Rhododendron griersonianum]|uniref:Uncharacterized protein n=2 Tax=Rhododendron griersonianum TaxID=479676 RepID=A0AAV6K1Y6_9ERIC|nr:hypothetical protein RHGRI_018579 [Rhododendron griersonianum]